MKKKFSIFIILFLAFIMLFSFSQQSLAQTFHFKLEGEINNAEYAFIDNTLSRAESENVELVILEINSLGGYVDPALKIRDRIFASDLEIVAFINGRAWSAAALIALSAEEIYISPSASIGAAETRPYEEKYISALRTEFAATAERRGKDPKIAEAMVDSDVEIESLIERDKLLTLTASEALNYEIADYIVSNIREIAEIKNISLASIQEIEKSNFERILGILSSPYISSLILIIAFSALIFEALTPGFALGGTVGIISLLIFFATHIFTGAIGTGIIVLFVIGIVLILAEIFLIPGFGVAGISGITAIFVSLFYIFPNRSVAINVLLAVIIFTLIIGALMIKKVGSSQFWRKISLDTSSKNYYSSSSKKTYLDKEGITLTKLRPAGTIKIDGQRVDAVTEGAFIEKDRKIKVISVSGSRVIVKEIIEEE